MLGTYRKIVVVACAAGLICGAAGLNLAEPPNPRTMRLYNEGPLAASEYPGKPADAPAGFGARTDTQLRYHAEFEYLVGPSTVICQVKELTFYAVLSPETSWADPERIGELLDHEQGHFDITQKHVLLATAALKPKVARKAIKASGATPEKAKAALSKRLEAEVKPFADRGIAENKAYDEATRHGTLSQAQTEWRTRQLEEIAELVSGKVKKASAKKPSASLQGESRLTTPTAKQPTTTQPNLTKPKSAP
jgi:hypothetical protein